MASEGPKSATLFLLVVNIAMYFVITVIAAWAVNHGIERSQESASVSSLSARIFPIYFPMGNKATGFFIIFSLIAGVVGFITSMTSFNYILEFTPADLYAAASASLISWALTLLAMGLACKEIDIGWTDSSLRTLEVITIITAATQMFCTGAIHVSANNAAKVSGVGGSV